MCLSVSVSVSQSVIDFIWPVTIRPPWELSFCSG